MQNELEELKIKVKKLEEIQKNCTHEWGEPQRNVTIEPVYDFKWHGENRFPEIAGYEEIPCLVRFCNICGKKEIAMNFEKVIRTEMRPKIK